MTGAKFLKVPSLHFYGCDAFSVHFDVLCIFLRKLYFDSASFAQRHQSLSQQKTITGYALVSYDHVSSPASVSYPYNFVCWVCLLGLFVGFVCWVF